MNFTCDKLLSGVLLGEHRLDKDNLIAELNERVISKGFNFTVINTTFCKTDESFPTHDEFIKWTKYLTENKIYFHLVRTAQKAPEGKISQMEERTVKEMREIAGEYFLGDCIAEPGLAYAAKGEFFLFLNWDIHLLLFSVIRAPYSHALGLPGSSACRWQIVGLLSLQ